ncbi:MAG: hypothetical protein C0501_29425 [Isosphaera sp.]|nr:hypothetical protein [Isosphaera sp.]
MTRSFALVLAAAALAPSAAPAQFIPAPGQGARANPASPIAPYRFQPYVGVRVNSVYGSFVAGQQIPYYSPLNNVTNIPFTYWNVRPQFAYGSGGGAGYGFGAPVTSGYMSGGTVRNTVVEASQRDMVRLQRDATAARGLATQDTAKNLIYDQWAYERLGQLGGLDGLKPGDQPEELEKALAADDAELASGDALNHILVAVVAAEAKGAKAVSAFLPPQVLDQVRFSSRPADPPAADALNLIRQAGRLPFPAAFADPKLAAVKDALEKDFEAAAAPLAAGKAAKPADLAKVGVTLGKAQEAATPVIRDLPFADAAAARRFLNRFEKALEVMKAPSAPTLVAPGWATEGASVADLVRHMTRHKLLFGPAPADGETAYAAVHKGLSAYLFALTAKK